MSAEQKFPLTKKAKAEFVKNYELIFLKEPPHNIKDETLVQMVNDNREKLTGNVKTSEQPSQEGIQVEGGQGQINPADEGQKGVGANGEQPLTPEQIEAEKQDLIETEKKYTEVFGKSPLIDYSIEKMKSEIEVEMERKAKVDELSKEYFSLFGKNPLSDMTEKQIVSAIENEKTRQGNVKTKSVEKVELIDDALKHNEETEMVIQRKKDPSDKRVINKNTFPYLKHDFEEVVKVPKEIQNKK